MQLASDPDTAPGIGPLRVSTFDAATYAAASGLLLSLAALAGLVSARRAARVDAATALRSE